MPRKLAPVKLAQRVERVVLLCRTLNDPYPTPRAHLVPDAGPAPSRYVPCETCRRRGEVRVVGGWQLCLLCDGTGWKRRDSSDPAWDAYLEMPLVEAAELPREPARRREPEPESGIEEAPYPWERLRRAYDRHGSYPELRVQLDWLGIVKPRRYRLVRGVLVDHEPRALDRRAHSELVLGVVMIATRMPIVRVPPWLIERTEAAQRRDSIEALAEQGLRAGEIAKRLGVSKEVVRRKLKPNEVGFAARRNPLRGDGRRTLTGAASPRFG